MIRRTPSRSSFPHESKHSFPRISPRNSWLDALDVARPEPLSLYNRIQTVRPVEEPGAAEGFPLIALAIQCPSCGLKLRHAARLLASIEGRRGTTRCPRCRDRIQFDLTGDSLELSFPDLYAEPEHLTARVARETAPPDSPSGDRASYVAVKGEAPVPSGAARSLAAPAVPRELTSELPAGTQLFGSDLFGSEQDLFSSAVDDPSIGTEFELFGSDELAAESFVAGWESGEEPVFPLVIPRRLRREG